MNEITKKYLKEFEKKSDQEIVKLFNKQVGVPGWCTSRGCYIAALHHEMERRNFDFSKVGGKGRLSFRHEIKLEGKTITVSKFDLENELGPDVIVIEPYLKSNSSK